MASPEKRNIVRSTASIDGAARGDLLGQRGTVIWFTGLSGSGKSTLAGALERALHERGIATYSLDGDNLRFGLNRDLGFSAEDRRENVRRVGEVAALFADAGIVVLAACISPYAADRAKAREAAPKDRFVEVYAKASVELCETRDTKGLYAKARAGEIPEFTGISAPYEEPESPDCEIDTSLDLAAGLATLLSHLESRGLIPAGGSS